MNAGIFISGLRHCIRFRKTLIGLRDFLVQPCLGTHLFVCFSPSPLLSYITSSVIISQPCSPFVLFIVQCPLAGFRVLVEFIFSWVNQGVMGHIHHLPHPCVDAPTTGKNLRCEALAMHTSPPKLNPFFPYMCMYRDISTYCMCMILSAELRHFLCM